VTWFAFKGSPTINLAGAQEKLAVSLGFHGYSTQAEAAAHPNSVNVLQQTYVNILELDYRQAVSAGQQPGGPNANLANPASDLSAGLTGVNAVGSFFNRLTGKNLWLRVAEFGIGGMLVYVSAKAMFPSYVNATAGPVVKKAKAAIR
jgi:hypothetical protein